MKNVMQAKAETTHC